MKMMKFPLFILFLLCFSSTLKAQYIQVDDTYTAQQLIEDVLIDSNCASVTNFSVTGGDFDSRGNSYGYFSAGTSTFPFANGIILSTGRAKLAEGPNNSLSDDGLGMNWPGDQDLEQILEAGRTNNATVLEFDFTPLSNKISFDYMLSSEEYHDNAPCRYADGFAFLLKQVGSTVPYQNLAIIPGTTTAVSTMNIRPEIGGRGGCPAKNEEYFGGFNGTEHPTNFNGQTIVMKAQADVISGQTYHIKLVIADEGNYQYDSAIFLGGGSFKIETDLGEPRLLADENPLCQNESLTLTATNPNAVSYEWFKNGIPQAEISDQFAITINETASYSVKVGLGGACFSTGEIKIEYSPIVNVSNAVLVQCDEDNNGLALFNLNQASDQITAADPSLNPSAFFRSYTEALGNTNAIANTAAFENTINPVFARTENQYGCSAISEVTLNVSNNNIADPANPLTECDIDTDPNDGFFTFNLQEQEAEILMNLPGGTVNYFTSYNDALSGLNAISSPNNFANTTAFEQTIYAKLSSGIDCYGIAEFKIIVNSFGNALDDENAIVCLGTLEPLDAGSGYTDYIWDTNPERYSQVIFVDAAGTYNVTVTNSNGCEGTKTFYVTASNIAEIASVTVNDFNGGNNSVTINSTPASIGNYEYSIDGIHFQDSPTFTNIKSGKYTAYVKNVCGDAVPYDFFVMDYPKFFTPNGDGIHEIWTIPYLNSQPNATAAIFDRYGKLVYFFKGNQYGWNGMHDGRTLPASDYWFKITLQSGREIRGHFSLVR